MSKNFLPLDAEYKDFFNAIADDPKISEKVYWTKVSIFDPKFMIEKIAIAPHKKWDWWWIYKNINLIDVEYLADINPAGINMDGLSANINLTKEFILKHNTWNWKSKYICSNKAFKPEQILDLCSMPELKIEIDANYLSKNANLSRDFVEANPQIEWNIRYLTLNPGTKESYFKDPPEDFNCYINYSEREEITPEFYLEHKDCFYNWNVLAERFPIDFILKEIDNNPNSRFNQCWNHISLNKNLTMKFVKENPQYPWCYRTMCMNPNIDPDDMEIHHDLFLKDLLLKIKDMYNTKHCTIFIDTDKPKIDEEIEKKIHTLKEKYGEDIVFFVKESEDFDSDYVLLQNTKEWAGLLEMKKVTIEDIKDYIITKNFKKYRTLTNQKFMEDSKYIMSLIYNDVSWRNITHNPNITFDFILDNIDKQFDWKHLSKIVPTETIKEYPSVLWDMDEHSEHAQIDINYVKENKDVFWSWKGLSKNKNFSYKDIWENKDLPWQYHIIFSNIAYNNRL